MKSNLSATWDRLFYRAWNLPLSHPPCMCNAIASCHFTLRCPCNIPEFCHAKQWEPCVGYTAWPIHQYRPSILICQSLITFSPKKVIACQEAVEYGSVYCVALQKWCGFIGYFHGVRWGSYMCFVAVILDNVGSN